MPKTIIVKRYKNEKEYQRDAQGMSRQGYKIISVAMQQPRRSLFTVIMTGFLVLLFPRKQELVVTYSIV